MLHSQTLPMMNITSAMQPMNDCIICIPPRMGDYIMELLSLVPAHLFGYYKQLRQWQNGYDFAIYYRIFRLDCSMQKLH